MVHCCYPWCQTDTNHRIHGYTCTYLSIIVLLGSAVLRVSLYPSLSHSYSCAKTMINGEFIFAMEVHIDQQRWNGRIYLMFNVFGECVYTYVCACTHNYFLINAQLLKLELIIFFSVQDNPFSRTASAWVRSCISSHSSIVVVPHATNK